MNDFINRIFRAVRLDPSLYSEVKADSEALGQAMAVVALSGLASGMGIAKSWAGFLLVMFFAFTVWLGWSFIAYIVGTRLFPGPQTKTDYLGLLRATGFAFAPHILQVFGSFPGFLFFATIVATLWTLIAIVIAIRQAFDFQKTFRAIGVVLISIVIQAIILMLLTSMFDGGGKTV